MNSTAVAIRAANTLGAIAAALLVYMIFGLVGTFYISAQCKNHGYNGGGLDWDYTRYCNAEHFTTVPGPRHIPYSEVVR